MCDPLKAHTSDDMKALISTNRTNLITGPLSRNKPLKGFLGNY